MTSPHGDTVQEKQAVAAFDFLGSPFAKPSQVLIVLQRDDG